MTRSVLSITQVRFNVKMAQRLTQKADEGFEGWDKQENLEVLQDKLDSAIDQGHYVDAANFAMMLWNLTGQGDR